MEKFNMLIPKVLFILDKSVNSSNRTCYERTCSFSDQFHRLVSDMARFPTQVDTAFKGINNLLGLSRAAELALIDFYYLLSSVADAKRMNLLIRSGPKPDEANSLLLKVSLFRKSAHFPSWEATFVFDKLGYITEVKWPKKN